MSWGLDFDVGDILSDVGGAIVDVAKEVELGDVLAVGAVAGSLYFQNEALKQQEEALKQQAQAARDSLASDPISLADTTEEPTVDIGDADIETEEDAEIEKDEIRKNVGKIEKTKDVNVKDNKVKTLIVPSKSGPKLEAQKLGVKL